MKTIKKHATIVTGGGRGIGRSISTRMARDTAVIVVGRTENDLLATCAEIHKNGGVAYHFVADISKKESSSKIVAFVEEKKLQVTNLICNASIAKSGPTETFDTDLWDDTFQTNVSGHLYLIQSCLKHMLYAKSGAICIMSSIAGVKGYSHTAAYSASKHALVGLAKSLALEYGKHGIVIVPICPGFVESEMTIRSIQSYMQRTGCSQEEAYTKIAAVNPQKRIIPATEVAEMVAFVCSGTVPSLSGNPIILSGGE